MCKRLLPLRTFPEITGQTHWHFFAYGKNITLCEIKGCNRSGIWRTRSNAMFSLYESLRISTWIATLAYISWNIDKYNRSDASSKQKNVTYIYAAHIIYISTEDLHSVKCVSFGNMCTCIYCILYFLHCVNLYCFVYVYLFLFVLSVLV
jgi:hypothetical protein